MSGDFDNEPGYTRPEWDDSESDRQHRLWVRSGFDPSWAPDGPPTHYVGRSNWPYDQDADLA